MLLQNKDQIEKGTLVKGIREGSRIFFSMPSDFALESLFYYSHTGEAFCEKSVYSIDRKKFDSFLLIYMLDGVLQVKVEGKTEFATKSDMVLLDCYEPHAYKAASNIRFYYFHFDGLSSRAYYDLIHENLGTVFPLAKYGLDERMRLYMEELINIAESPVRDEHQVSVKIHRVLSALATCDDESGYTNLETIQKAVVYMEKHLTEYISVSDIADHVCLDISYFSKIFKRHMNNTPHTYLNNRRIERAKELLWTTDLPIETVSLKCGFEHATSFYRAFKRMTGYSPSSFRNL